jgi:DUF4097 and DUF4098 domain-containing protein YvlB
MNARFSNVRNIVPTLVLVVALSCANAFAVDKVTEEMHQTYPLAANGRVKVENVNGNVQITGWDRDEVKLDAVKTANTKEELDAVKIEVDTKADSIQIQTKYPPRSNNNSTSVEYTLSVPKKALLDGIADVNGNIVIQQTAGDVEASTVNGTLETKQTSGSLKLSSVNGKVDATPDQLDSARTVSVDAVNGRVILTLAANANADISAKTVNGSISTDHASLNAKKNFPIGSNLNGKLGAGGAKFRLSTVNGSIKIAVAAAP